MSFSGALVHLKKSGCTFNCKKSLLVYLVHENIHWNIISCHHESWHKELGTFGVNFLKKWKQLWSKWVFDFGSKSIKRSVMNGSTISAKSSYQNHHLYGTLGRRKSDCFSVMKYFGFIKLTRSVNSYWLKVYFSHCVSLFLFFPSISHAPSILMRLELS